MAKIDFTPVSTNKDVNFTPDPTFASKIGSDVMRAASDIDDFRGGLLSSLGRQGANVLGHLGINVTPGRPVFYNPEATSSEWGRVAGDITPYIAGGELGAAAKGADLLAPELTSGLGGIAASSAGYGALGAATAPRGQEIKQGLFSAAGVPIGEGASLAGEAVLKKIAGLTPKEHLSHIFSMLSQPKAENYKDIVLTEGKEGLAGMKPVAMNETAAAKLIRNQYEDQKNIARQNYEENILNPLENMGMGNSLNAVEFNPLAKEAVDDGFFKKNSKLKAIGAKVNELLNQKASPMFGKESFMQSLRDSHNLQSDLGQLGVKYIKSTDSERNEDGDILMTLRHHLKNDIMNHLSSIPSSLEGLSMGDLYNKASQDYLKNVVPYHNIPTKILNGEDTNPKNFSKYFANPNLNLLNEKTSMLNIPNQFGNDELSRRIILDQLKNSSGYIKNKNPESIVNGYNDLQKKGFSSYADKVPEITKHVKVLDNKISKAPLFSGVIPAMGASGLMALGLEPHLGTGGAIGSFIGGSAILPTVLPKAVETVQKVARGKLAQQAVKLPARRKSKSLLSAALAKLSGEI